LLPPATRLEQLHPRFSRLHEERGHVSWRCKDAPQAIDAFCAREHQSGAAASWSMLEGLYRLTGDAAERRHRRRPRGHAQAPAAEVVTATPVLRRRALRRRSRSSAPICCGTAITRGDAAAGQIGIARDVLDDAELLLEAVLALAPDYRAARHDYAAGAGRTHKYQQARPRDRALLRLEPGNRTTARCYATACVGLGEHEKAIAALPRAARRARRIADLHLSIAHALKTVGQARGRSTPTARRPPPGPGFGDAYWSLANLKTYRFTTRDRAHARRGGGADAPVDRYHLCFALGKALEDRGEYAESWRYYERGNALKRAESRYRPEIIETNTRSRSRSARASSSQPRRLGRTAADPIFIVGLPRSGSTLLEQILASHSQVEGTQELPDIQRIVLGAAGPRSRPRQSALSGRAGADDAEDFRGWASNI
jgi:tetratricopeptide (TPR) repeat protein